MSFVLKGSFRRPVYWKYWKPFCYILKIKVKHVKDKPFKIRKQFSHKNLQNTMKEKHCRPKELKIELNDALSFYQMVETYID